MTIKPKPIIQKITFTEQQQQEINDLLERKPTQSTSKYARGRLPSHNYVKERLKRYYYHGSCACGKLPDYKVIYQYDGIQLIEHYCEDHLPKQFSN
jgi:hypothetical protein